MGIFDRFPYSSTHEMNLDFMLGKATEIAEDMQRVTAGMEQVQAGLTAISEKTEQATQAAAQAAQSASSIEGSVTAAEEAAEEAQMHNESAQTWANNAMTYKADCQRSATEAAASSSSAAQAATAAAASEDTVATYAQAANASAQSAANNNDSAHQYANQASASASNATFHSSNAQTAATNAQTAATNANTSATNASASADRAASLKTDVENLVESLPEDFTDLNNTVNQLSDKIDDIGSDVTDLKYQRMDDAEENIERLETNFNDVICYNLMGADSSVYYPVKLSPGDRVTFSKKDGSVFSSSSTLICAFCDINKSARVNKALNTNTTEVSYTIPSGFDFRFLKWNEAPGEVMVNLGDKRPYVVYNADTIEAKVNEIADVVEESETQKNLINIENGFFAIGTMKNGDRPFTNDEVSPGDIVHYDFVSPSGAIIGILRLRDSSNNNLSFYVNQEGDNDTRYWGGVGRDAATRPEEYKGSFIIPENFDHCFVQCNGANTITVKELYVNKYEDRIATEGMDIPRYYFNGNYLPAKATSINERLETCMANGDAFIFITDLHLKSNQKRSPSLIRYLCNNTCVNKLIYGGDLLDGGQANEYPLARKFTKEMREAFPRIQFFTVGNHDTFQNNPSSRITTWADTMEEHVVGDASHHYFYYDNPRAKIRYIFLNRYYDGDQNTSSGFYVDTVQRDWFANTALDMETGWGAIVFIHNLYNFNYTVTPLIMTVDEGCKSYLADVCDAYNANENSKGEVIAIVQGHTHSDRVLRTDGGIPIIITTCDKNAQADSEQPDILFPDGVDDRESGTIREQAFDVVIVNRKRNSNGKGTIYAIRVGCEAYDGITVSDMGSATQERVILYDEKF